MPLGLNDGKVFHIQLGGMAGLSGLILPCLIALFALSTLLSAPVLNYICIWILHIGECNI